MGVGQAASCLCSTAGVVSPHDGSCGPTWRAPPRPARTLTGRALVAEPRGEGLSGRAVWCCLSRACVCALKRRHARPRVVLVLRARPFATATVGCGGDSWRFPCG